MSNILSEWWNTVVFPLLLPTFAGWKCQTNARRRCELLGWLAGLSIQTSADCAVHHGKSAAAATQPGATLRKQRTSAGTLFLSNFDKLHG
jgi:hypothetical protein